MKEKDEEMDKCKQQMKEKDEEIKTKKQQMKDKDEEMDECKKQMKEKDEEIKFKEHQMKEKDEQLGECKKQKREMEEELLTIACLSSLDELKLVLKQVKDLRECEKAEVEVLKEDLIVQQRVEELQKKKITTRKCTESCKESLSLPELINLKSVSSSPSVSKSSKARARKRLRAQPGVTATFQSRSETPSILASS
jgi:hypothetical protein